MSARESYTCPKCSKTTFPSFVLSSRMKLVVQCANVECLFEDQSLGPADFNRGVASMPEDGATQTSGWAGKRAVVVDTAASAPPAPMPTVSKLSDRDGGPPNPARPIFHTGVSPTDVIGMIEDRSLWLQAEDARLAGVIAQAQAQRAGVQAESKSLQRMLRAARREATPPAPIALRVVGGS